MEDKKEEEIITRENGLQFTKVQVEKIFQNRAYVAKFKYSFDGKLFMETEISGTSNMECKEKVEKFLDTKLHNVEIIFNN